MKSIRVFDPAMCCSTGVCGPTVDPRLPKFAADLDWLKGQGVSVERFNLSQEPRAFASDVEVRTTLQTHGQDGLPLIKADDEVMSRGTYPTREELASWAGVGAEAGAGVGAAATPSSSPPCC
ncbi:MAG: arsenical resistance operon transcriptional repressor ArsD [Gemmatimonadales bacterium]|nr:MAG: arsenical resistance operon transcriptional repressor ArsD [Gemmatimonadales bacterium]